MFAKGLESLTVELVGRADMLSRSAPIIAVMNVVVIMVVATTTITNLGMTEIRGTVRSLSVAAPAVTTAWHTGL